MRYMMKRKFWSWGDNFTIKDEHEQDAYSVRGKAFSWGDNLTIHDPAGRELARISQTLMSWKPRYEIYRDGRRFAELVKEFSWFKQEFTLDVPGPNDYTIIGSFWGHEYTFERGGAVVARVSKKFWSLSDTYGIETIPGEDDVAILATCVVIELVCQDQKE
ncbi:LURP-one-related/scramblase family protein [Candidatus Sumerlaeota bacterium]